MNRSATLWNSLMLAPLLGATGSVAGAAGTVVMFALVMGAYGACMRPLRSRLQGHFLQLAGVLFAASLSSCVDILLQRVSLQWQQTFSLYAGLIALQCVVLEHNGFFRSVLTERFKLAALFSLLMLSLGTLRELVSHGSLGQGFSRDWQGLVLFNGGLNLAALVPGALIILGLLLAAWRACGRPASLSKETHHP